MSNPGTTPMHPSQAHASEAFFCRNSIALVHQRVGPSRAPEELPWLNKAPFLPPLPCAGSNGGSPPLGMEADLLWRHASTTHQLAGNLSAFLPCLSRSPFGSACPMTRGAPHPSASLHKTLCSTKLIGSQDGWQREGISGLLHPC